MCFLVWKGLPTQTSSAELFGADTYGPQGDVYGPVNYAMDRGMKQDLENYVEHGGMIGRRGPDAQRMARYTTGDRGRLGPSAAAMLHSARTSNAMREYAAHTSRPAERRNAPMAESALEQSGQTDALQMQEAAGGDPAAAVGSTAYGRAEGADGGLSSARGARVQRVYQENAAASQSESELPRAALRLPAEAPAHRAVVAAAAGRATGGRGSGQLLALRRRSRRTQEALARLRDESRVARRAAAAAERREEAVQGDERAIFPQAESARRNALKMARALLAEKKRAALLEARSRSERERATEAAAAAKRLAAASLAEKRSFLDVAGPVHKAEEAVKVANRAYNTAVMQLAHAETSAESVSAAHPKLEKAAMAKVDKYRRASRHMEELVQSATARLNRLEGRDGPVTDLDSHYQTPKIRAEAKLKEAARLHAKALATARRAAVLRSDVKVQIPELRAAIKAADGLHQRYEGLVHRQAADQAAYARLEAVAAGEEQAERAARAALLRDDRAAVALREAFRG